MLLVAIAFAGELRIETEVPVDLLVDGHPAAKLFGPGELTVELVDGEHTLTVYRGDGAEELPFEVGPDGTTVRIGTTLLESSATPEPTPADSTTGEVVLRLVEGRGATIIWAGERHALAQDGSLRFEALDPGEYEVEARSADMTYIWMRGTVTVEAGDELVLALSEGRAPECFGRPEAWQPDR